MGRTYGLPSDVGESWRDDHDDHEAEEPVTGAGNGVGLRTAAQRCYFSAVEERSAHPGEPEEGVEEEEEARSNKLTGAASGAGQTGNDPEADSHSACRDHESLAATKPLNKKDGQKRAQCIFETAHCSDEMRHAGSKIEGLLKDFVGVGRDHVDTRQLLSRLNESADCDAVKRLGLAVLEEFFVGEGGQLRLGFERSDDAVTLGEETWVVRRHTTKLGEVVRGLRLLAEFLV